MSARGYSSQSYPQGQGIYVKDNAFTFGDYTPTNNINGATWYDITVNTSGVYKIYLSSLSQGTYGVSGWTADRRIELWVTNGNNSVTLGTAGSYMLYPSLIYPAVTMCGSIFIPSVQLTAGQHLYLRVYNDNQSIAQYELIIFK